MSLAVAAAAAALALAGCSGGDGTTDEPDAAPTIPAETATGEAGATGSLAETGEAAAPPADLPGTAAVIQAELDATLTDLREVDSLDELRADLEAAAESAATWRDQLAAAPDDEQLAEQRAALDEALENLETALGDLSARSDEAGEAQLGELARMLTPDSLDSADEVRAALEAILQQAG
jgi:hypothetical protein